MKTWYCEWNYNLLNLITLFQLFVNFRHCKFNTEWNFHAEIKFNFSFVNQFTKSTLSSNTFFQFFRHCATFEFFCIRRAPPSSFSDILQQIKCQTAQRVSPFMYFGTMRLFEILIFRFFSKVKKIRKFLSQRVRPPFNLFDILQQTGFSKSSKGPPSTGLKTLRFLSLRYSADFRRSLLVLQAFRSMFPLFPVLWDFPLFGFVRLSKIF